jgi:hypothetical protein
MAQWWEALLHATDGKLELDTWFYYIMDWEFEDEGNSRLATPDELGDTITIRDSKEEEITHKDCNTQRVAPWV